MPEQLAVDHVSNHEPVPLRDVPLTEKVPDQPAPSPVPPETKLPFSETLPLRSPEKVPLYEPESAPLELTVIENVPLTSPVNVQAPDQFPLIYPL